jgi:hypothetical protein
LAVVFEWHTPLSRLSVVKVAIGMTHVFILAEQLLHAFVRITSDAGATDLVHVRTYNACTLSKVSDMRCDMGLVVVVNSKTLHYINVNWPDDQDTFQRVGGATAHNLVFHVKYPHVCISCCYCCHTSVG